jgi:hypothetical protein
MLSRQTLSAGLAAALDDWRAVAETPAGPVRTCFRLVEPPAGVELDTAGAFRFLTETGPMLAGAGFGVLLPDWARKARVGLKLTSRTRSSAGTGADGGVSAAGFGLHDLVKFRYELAVGDTTLGPGELAELARLKIPLVRIRGQWVELDERNLKAALRFLESDRSGEMPAGWPAGARAGARGGGGGRRAAGGCPGTGGVGGRARAGRGAHPAGPTRRPVPGDPAGRPGLPDLPERGPVQPGRTRAGRGRLGRGERER